MGIVRCLHVWWRNWLPGRCNPASILINNWSLFDCKENIGQGGQDVARETSWRVIRTRSPDPVPVPNPPQALYTWQEYFIAQLAVSAMLSKMCSWSRNPTPTWQLLTTRGNNWLFRTILDASTDCICSLDMPIHEFSKSLICRSSNKLRTTMYNVRCLRIQCQNLWRTWYVFSFKPGASLTSDTTTPFRCCALPSSLLVMTTITNAIKSFTFCLHFDRTSSTLSVQF